MSWESTQRQILRMLARDLPEAKRYVAAGGRGIPDAAKMQEAILRYAATPRSREELIALIARRAARPPRAAAGGRRPIHRPALPRRVRAVDRRRHRLMELDARAADP